MVETQLERHAGFVILRVSGDLRLWGRSERGDELVNILRSGMQDHPSRVVLNLRGLTNVDSMGISALVRIPVECGRQKLGLHVVLPSGIAGHALERVRILDGWPSYNDEAAAIKAAQAQA